MQSEAQVRSRGRRLSSLLPQNHVEDSQVLNRLGEPDLNHRASSLRGPLCSTSELNIILFDIGHISVRLGTTSAHACPSGVPEAHHHSTLIYSKGRSRHTYQLDAASSLHLGSS